MISRTFSNYSDIRSALDQEFMLYSQIVDVGEWQSTDVRDKPEMVTRELANVTIEFTWDTGNNPKDLTIPANQPWAEAHFQERISGHPWNPPPSHEMWPYAQQDNAGFISGSQFSHTYPERLWPKFVNEGRKAPNGRQIFVPHMGLRFEYGDLADVIDLLRKNPLTRQAYIPIWFPEDTGVNHGERVPCTLGYHVMVRNDQLQITYYIRSCDWRRHFADDLYMAARLAQFIANCLSELPGEGLKRQVTANRVIMHIASLHIFQGDWEIMRHQRAQWIEDTYCRYGTSRNTEAILKGLG